VVLAMNQMVEKLKALFAEEAARSERLRQAAYQDELTGLANRRLLDSRLASQLDSSEHNADGHLLMVQINDLNGLNQRHGAAYSDRLILAVGQLLSRINEQLGQPDWLAARSRGSEFILLAPGTHGDEASRLVDELQQQLETLRATGASDCTPVAHVGLAAFTQGDKPGAVLGRADQALALSQASGTARAVNQPGAQPLTDQHSWHKLLDDALGNGTLDLFLQPVALTGGDNKMLHHKVLARVRRENGESIPAGQFLPWIDRLGWGARFDRVVLEQVMSRLQSAAQPLALSLSAATLRDALSREAILQQLRRHPQQASLLSLELDARHLSGSQELQEWSQKIRATGARLGLQHFGGQFSHIGNLTHLGLAYLKIDGAYIRAIDEDSDKRMFIEAIYRTTNSIDLPLIAEMVETQGELQVLAELGVKGAMGHLVGAPRRWDGRG
jgi:diguanylate cyclase (GGDEF)-like protein